MLLAITLNIISLDAIASKDIKVPCHSSSTPSPGWVHIDCATCNSTLGFGTDIGTCEPD